MLFKFVRCNATLDVELTVVKVCNWCVFIGNGVFSSFTITTSKKGKFAGGNDHIRKWEAACRIVPQNATVTQPLFHPAAAGVSPGLVDAAFLRHFQGGERKPELNLYPAMTIAPA